MGIEALGTVLHRERARADFYEQALTWALGGGPMPCDEEAEAAAMAYLCAIVGEGFGVARRFLDRALPLLVGAGRFPTAETWQEPSMTWSEAIGRLEAAAGLRAAWRATSEAQRRIVAGDAVGGMAALREAMGAIRGGVARQGEIRAEALDWVRDPH